jgi:hypothetical protein
MQSGGDFSCDVNDEKLIALPPAPMVKFLPEMAFLLLLSKIATNRPQG